ncbi:MAG TPA: hypothetical protein VF584_20115 [Longimicrobium sp.]|jgi:hypothetical protein
MWTTRDGYTLQLPHDSLHTILSRLRPEQLRGITGGPLAGDPGPLLVRAVGRAAQAARRTPETIGGQNGPPLPVFSAPGFRLLVRPRGPTEGEILMVRPEDEADAELVPVGASGSTRPYKHPRTGKSQDLRVRGARVQITWKQLPLAQARNLGVTDPRKVVYVLAKRTAAPETVNGKTKKSARELGGTYLRPLYVGETKEQDRMRPRIDVLRAFDVDFAPYVVCVGTIAALPSQRVQQQPKDRAFAPTNAADLQLLREDVEHVLVRILTNTGYELTVRTPRNPVWINDLGISVSHVNPPAFLDPRGVSLGKQATPYEIAPIGWG